MRQAGRASVVIILGLLLIDQLTKLFILENNLELNGLFFINNQALTIGLLPTTNAGIAFSMKLPQIITIVAVPALLVLLSIWLYKKIKADNYIYSVLLSVVIGGSLSNWVDRIYRGGVVDFIGIKVAGINFAILNLADLAITIGIIIILLIETNIIKSHENI